MKSVNIGTWHPYNMWIDEEQKEEQLYHITKTSLENGLGNVKFIYTKTIDKMNQYLADLIKQIKVVDSTKMIMDEVYYTAVIEGAKTTVAITQELHNGTRLPKDKSEHMVKNGFDAVKLLNLYGNNLTIEKLINVWNVIVRNCCENEHIRGERFRIGNVEVGGFIPVDFNRLENLMSGFMNFWYSDELSEYPFIKTILLHYAYEVIHPFCDGNGRLGRLLLNNYLVQNGIEVVRALAFSPEICKTRHRFDVAISDSENEYNDCTPFIEYMLDTMINSCLNILDSNPKVLNSNLPLIDEL